MSPEMMPIDELCRLARDAGAAVMQVYASDFAVRGKTDASPVTDADEQAEAIILAGLARLTPEVPVVAEESVAAGRVPAIGERFWLVDPLDGTREFVNRNGEFTVNIALVRDHQPVLGVVHVPVSGVTYTGVVGQGATRRTGDAPPEPICVQRSCADPVRVVGSRSHANPRLRHYLEAIGDYELVSMGSSLKFCLLAEGKADLYPRLGPTSEWDTAAAHAVVVAAGGHIVTLDNSPLKYNCKASLLNPEFLVFGDAGRDWPALFRDCTD